ncbi:MAG: transketolase C-terminal domain-containing protein [Clostridia bacterium]
MLDNKELREVYVDELIRLGKENENILVFEADLAAAHKTKKFQSVYPERFFDVGIAESNMIGVAAGMASYGKIPFCASFGTFTSRRCYDQVFISVAYARQNVKIVGSDPGIAAELNGGTHMPFEDMGLMRNVPTMLCVEPTDQVQFEALMPQIVAHKGPVYIRLFRKNCEKVYNEGEVFDIYKAKTISEGTDCNILASGIEVSKALQASEILKAKGLNVGVTNTATWKPLDNEKVLELAKLSGCLVTCENHSVINGLGSAVSGYLIENYPIPVQMVGVRDKFGEVGKMDYLEKAFHLAVEDIVDAVEKAIKRK